MLQNSRDNSNHLKRGIGISRPINTGLPKIMRALKYGREIKVHQKGQDEGICHAYNETFKHALLCGNANKYIDRVNFILDNPIVWMFEEFELIKKKAEKSHEPLQITVQIQQFSKLNFICSFNILITSASSKK